MTDAEEQKIRNEVRVKALWIAIALFFLLCLAFLFGWNVGLVPVVAALGGHIAKINFWIAFGAIVFLRALRGAA